MFGRRKKIYISDTHQKRKRFRWLKITLISLGSIIILPVLFAFLFRQNLLNWAVEKAKNKAKKYHATLVVGSATISGIADVEITNVSLIPDNADTLLHIGKASSGLRIWKLMTGNIMLSHLQLDQGFVNLVRYDSTRSNYSNFTKQKDSDEVENNSKISLAQKGYKIIKNVLGQIPGKIEVGDFTISYTRGENKYYIKADGLRLDDELIKCNIDISTPSAYKENIVSREKKVRKKRKHSKEIVESIVEKEISTTQIQRLKVEGFFNPDKMTGDVNIKSREFDMMYMPLVQEKMGLKLGAKELNLKLNEVAYDNGELVLKTFAEMKDIIVNHPRLANNDVKVSVGSGDIHVMVGENYITLDSSSTFKLNKINVHPYFRYQRSPVIDYDFKIATDRIGANDFFNSLPDGMFESLSGIDAEGFLTYRMDCHLCDTSPWDCSFNSDMQKENFRINRFGKAYLPMINGEFVYTAYDYGNPQKIIVGPDNSNYTNLEDISNYLKNAVLTTEDPAFFGHQGFIVESIRQSIAQNYVYKRFVRGGSTISMQLVKNIYLSRQKTLTRKMEEMLLVWMIENLGIVSKHRMFEVYMNIIEWGPGVYGIGEASRFYFEKSPSQLNLQEAIFMASIIPHPKWFASSFNDTTQMLKKHFKGYYTQISGLMVGRKLIEPEDTTGLEPNVLLRGPAKNLLRKAVPISDSAELYDNPPLLMDDIRFRDH